LKEQLRYLLQLQAIDIRVKEIEATRASLPQRLEPLLKDLAKLESMLAGERLKLGETEAWQKQQSFSLEREHEALRAAKGKLSGSRTGKEYNAASREVDNRRKTISEREAELKKVAEGLESATQAIAEREQAVAQLRDQVATEQGEVEVKVTALTADAEAAAAGRDELRASIDDNWLRIYDSLSTRRGFAVAPVEGGTCQGCQMRIPPQLNNVLARMESMETCPRCGRIIYRLEMIEETAGADDAGS